ncbi:PadR family transcriptional regulator [Salinicoccus sp. ID82-1]|uniref:PadR family transcriptional regulator n=1 Tax=Salinicoccus cyprini TaxID=2493691 RepID=A0A558AQX4_9STAP|nr:MULTISPECIES: PadR family transcriptional regulator [Salinicoccus]MCG1010275.1 PadR family transcriptional regulator [Salinicoccus sp. ID82-1]TVT26671.1 PadR family transcriptional regulator [Salinicoccus cyprini]
MSIQIFILSRLMQDNSYPYKLKKQLSEPLPLDELANLTESKLYYNFDALAKKGLIEIVEVIKEDHRPDKQVFAITDKGREALPKLIYKLFENAGDIKDMIVGLTCLKYVDREEVVRILENKAVSIEERWAYVREMEDRIQVNETNAKMVDLMKGYVTARKEHTLHWLKIVIERIRNNEI